MSADELPNLGQVLPAQISALNTMGVLQAGRRLQKEGACSPAENSKGADRIAGSRRAVARRAS
jgi:hypothetical protein